MAWLRQSRQEKIIREAGKPLLPSENVFISHEYAFLSLAQSFARDPFEDRELHTVIEMALYKHQLEQRLRAHEQWLDTTLKSIGDAVIATDIEGQIVFMNPVAETLTGCSQSEAEGKKLVEVLTISNKDNHTPVNGLIAKVVKEGIIVALDNQTILVAKDGQKRPIDSNIAPIRNHKGIISGIVLVFRDITERRQVEELKQKQAEQLEAMVKERTQALQATQEKLIRRERLAVLGQLAGGVAHELRNPLSIVSNALYFLKETQTSANETSKEYLEIITTHTNKMQKIISDLLDLSRIRSVVRQEIAVAYLIADVFKRQPVPEEVIVKNPPLKLGGFLNAQWGFS